MKRVPSLFFQGARDSSALCIGALPFGVIFGALAVGQGLPLPATLAMSLVVFAGSAQFIALGLLAAGASIPVILLTTFVVNLRHALYGATLAPKLRGLGLGRQARMAFLLTDETFAVVSGRLEEGKDLETYYLGSAAFMYANWQFATLAGALFGNLVPDIASWGLDFAMPVAFIGMLAPYLRRLSTGFSALAAGCTALATVSLPNKLGLILAALGGVAAGVLIDTLRLKEER